MPVNTRSPAALEHAVAVHWLRALTHVLTDIAQNAARPVDTGGTADESPVTSDQTRTRGDRDGTHA